MYIALIFCDIAFWVIWSVSCIKLAINQGDCVIHLFPILKVGHIMLKDAVPSTSAAKQVSKEMVLEPPGEAPSTSSATHLSPQMLYDSDNEDPLTSTSP